MFLSRSVPSGSVDSTIFVKRDGSQAFTGDMPAGGYRIINLGAPVAGTDAATKAYVDSRVLPVGSHGSLLFHNGTAWVSLPIGTAGQLLRVVAGEPKWVTLTASDIGAIPAPGAPITGSLLYYGGSWQSTAAGVSRQPLLSGGGMGPPVWDTDVVPLTQRVIDGASTSVSVGATFAHDLTSGGGGNGIGTRCLIRARNSAEVLTDVAAVDGVLATATSGSEVGVLDVRLVNGGGGLSARSARFWASGVALGGVTAAPPSDAGIALAWDSRSIVVRGAGDVSWVDVWRVSSMSEWVYGTSDPTYCGAVVLLAPDSGAAISLRCGSTDHLTISSSGMITVGTTSHATVLRGSQLTIGISSVVTQYQGGARVPERTVWSDAVLDAQDEVVFVDTTSGPVTLTLPSGASGRVLVIQRVAGGANVVVQRVGSDTIRAGGSSGLTSWTISDNSRHGLIYRVVASEWVAEA
jgi:hypothetical protein